MFSGPGFFFGRCSSLAIPRAAIKRSGVSRSRAAGYSFGVVFLGFRFLGFLGVAAAFFALDFRAGFSFSGGGLYLNEPISNPQELHDM